MNRVDVALGGGLTVAFAVRAFLSEAWRRGLYALPFVGLWALDFVCLFIFVVPALRL